VSIKTMGIVKELVKIGPNEVCDILLIQVDKENSIEFLLDSLSYLYTIITLTLASISCILI